MTHFVVSFVVIIYHPTTTTTTTMSIYFRAFLFLWFVVCTLSFTSQKSFLSRTKYTTLSSTNNENIVPSSTPEPTKKGFGKVQVKVEPEVIKDAGTVSYEAQAKRGVPEYSIFIRPTNGTETEWIPVGSMVGVSLYYI